MKLLEKSTLLAVVLLSVSLFAVVGCIPVPERIPVRRVEVAPFLVDCVGVGPMKCMLIRDTSSGPRGDYKTFYDTIGGFGYEEGYEYVLDVKVEIVPHPPADGSDLRWTLVSVVSKTKSDPSAARDAPAAPRPPVIESFVWEAVNATAELSTLPKPDAIFDSGGTLSGSTGCNEYRATAAWTVDEVTDVGNVLSESGGLTIGDIAMTRRACPPPIDEIEKRYVSLLERAEGYKAVTQGEASGDLTLYDNDGNLVVTYVAVDTLRPTTPSGEAVVSYGESVMWEVRVFYRGGAATAVPIDGTLITLEFDMRSPTIEGRPTFSGGTASGSAGCNSYTAEVTMSSNGDISIGDVAATLRLCTGTPSGVMDQEHDYISAFSRSAHYEDITLNSVHTFRLLDSDKQLLIEYTEHISRTDSPVCGLQKNGSGLPNCIAS